MDLRSLDSKQQRLLMIAGTVLVLGFLWVLLGSVSHRSPFAELTSQMEGAFRKGDFSRAQKKAEERLTLAQKTFPADSPEITDSIHDIGTAYLMQGDFEKAKGFFEQAATLEIKARGTESLGLPEKLVSLAQADLKLGKYVDALGLATKALAFYEAKPPKKNPHPRYDAFDIASAAALRGGDCAGAKTTADKGLVVLRETREIELIAQLSETAAKSAVCLGQPNDALPYLKEGIGAAGKIKGPNAELLPQMLYLQGQILCKTDRCKQGIKSERDAQKVASKMFSAGDPRLKQYETIDELPTPAPRERRGGLGLRGKGKESEQQSSKAAGEKLPPDRPEADLMDGF